MTNPNFKKVALTPFWVLDPDLNVLELRGRNEDLSSIGEVVEYVPEN